ncbi:SGNH/GDSL hydrolase family protein, partial [Spirosoma sp.]|uniref:SGNH/GDSL hydrolase family protein n=1 Tax=Spirosoma sp. TaxID=1899569 RepID=UPI003B3AAAF2
LIGVNNQYRGESLHTYRKEFRELLQTATTFADNKAHHVFVLSIPDWGASPFAAERNKPQIAREIDQFNAVAKDECQKAGIAYIDITYLSRAAAGDHTQFASDGLHYSAKQMRMWAEKALPVVKKIITE